MSSNIYKEKVICGFKYVLDIEVHLYAAGDWRGDVLDIYWQITCNGEKILDGLESGKAKDRWNIIGGIIDNFDKWEGK